MRFLSVTILTMIAAYAICLFLPWWSITIAAFLPAFFIYQRGGFAFMSGFFALLLLWGTLAWYISAANDHILASKVAMLVIKSDNAIVLVLLTAVTGAITAGMSALTGSLFRSITFPRN